MKISQTECCVRGVCATHCISMREDADALTLEELRKKYIRVPLYRRVRGAPGRIWKKIPTWGGGMKQAFHYGLVMEFSSR